MKLALLALALMVSPSLADPKPVCKPGGALVFEADQRRDDKSVLDTKLYASGAWAVDEARGDSADQRRGCATAEQRAQIDKLVKSAPWTVTTARITCRAFSAESTVYTIAGKTFTQRLCGAEHLDDKSDAALQGIKAIVAGLK